MGTPIYERKGFKEYRKAKQERDAQIARIKAGTAVACAKCAKAFDLLEEGGEIQGNHYCDDCFGIAVGELTEVKSTDSGNCPHCKTAMHPDEGSSEMHEDGTCFITCAYCGNVYYYKDSSDICVMCKEEGTGLSDDNGSPLCDKCFHEIYAVCGECGGITQDREFQIFGCVHCARVIPLNGMRDALDSFRKSANEICELWELMPGDLMHDKEVNSRYPFKESFDDIIIQIAGWTEGAQERINSYLKEGK